MIFRMKAGLNLIVSGLYTLNSGGRILHPFTLGHIEYHELIC